jgi:Aminotransferase class-III
VLFIADEVICGFGRTGNMWGSQTFDLVPDSGRDPTGSTNVEIAAYPGSDPK